MRRAATLGIDVGTQGTKALLVACDDGSTLGRGARAHAPLAPSSTGRAEQDPREWLEAVVAAARAALASASAPVEVLGIGVSGQQHGCVLVDERDEPVSPAKLWCDTETADEADELAARLARAVPVGWTASKALHAIRRRGDEWRRADALLLPHEWINARLCGVRAAEPGDASGTGWLDPTTRRHDHAMLEAIGGGIERKLPPLVPSDAIVGGLLPDMARRLGLPDGVPVSAGGGDNMMSAIGAGAAAEGVVVASLGTSATIFARSAKPILDPRALVSPFCDSAGAWLPLLCLLNCTGVLEELRRGFALEHDELARLALAAPAGGEGLVCLPWLAGERVPALPRATGSFAGLRGGMLAPGPLGRAVVEGVAHGLALCLARLRLFGLAPAEVRLVGGASRSPLWTRVLADALALRVVPLAEAETAALGAALQAQWAARRAGGETVELAPLAARGIALRDPIEPDAAGVAALERARAGFLELLEREHGASARPDRP
ncbi:MAG: xylulokinase [Planctomycetota bacterium]|jgi:D-xylulose kinase